LVAGQSLEISGFEPPLWLFANVRCA
jgi:hypothetical protein